MSGEMVPIILFICITVMILGYYFFSNKNKEIQQITLQKLIDNGQTLSPELVMSIAKPVPSSNNKNFSRGVLFISFAIAIILYGWLVFANEPEFMATGLFPFCLGVGFLLIYKFKPQDV